jgi:hypothetical protein
MGQALRKLAEGVAGSHEQGPCVLFSRPGPFEVDDKVGDLVSGGGEYLLLAVREFLESQRQYVAAAPKVVGRGGGKSPQFINQGRRVGGCDDAAVEPQGIHVAVPRA